MQFDKEILIWRINHGQYIDQRDPKRNALYTAYITKEGTKISKELAVNRVIKRLIQDGNKKRAQELKSIFNDPELSDNRNYLLIELVPWVIKQKKPEDPKQLQFNFGSPTPLNIESVFKKTLNEMMEADVVGTSGSGSVWSGDTYAKGDARVPKSIFGGVIFKRPGMTTKNKKRKKSKKDFVQYIKKLIP
jgi:hypothetical protein